MFIYLGGALIAAIYLINLIPGGWAAILSTASVDNKFSVFNFGFDNGFSGFFNQPYTLIGGILGGAFLSIASHGTDQLIVQKLLAAKNLKESQKAIIGSGVIIIFQFALFLFIGVLLYTYYGTLNLKSDTIFPKFIIEVLPSGLFGILIAGLLAVSLSTLAGSISSLSQSTIMDLYLPFLKKEISENSKLKISKSLSILWTVLLVASAFFFMNTTQTVVELALSIASFTYGGLLGTFLLGIFFKNAKQKDALTGFVVSILVMILVISFKLVAWTWFTIIGVIATLVVGGTLSKISSSKKKN